MPSPRLARLLPPSGRAAAAAALLALALPREAAAWSRAGHMVHGAIAYQDLYARDSSAARRVAMLLRAHPEYQARWLPQLARQGMEMHDVMLFMLAARWPDDVRDDPAQHHPTWHYTNFTFVPRGDTTKAPANAGGDVLIETEHNFAVLRDPRASDAAKAIALCWIFHLVGDVHQPLHTVTLFSSRWPEGDRGGNLFWVRASTLTRAVNLHAYWDGLVNGSDDVRWVLTRAANLRAARPRDQVGTLMESLSPAIWARTEGVPLAIRWAYLDGTLAGGDTPETAPVLPAAYAVDARRVAEAQVTLAGYRLSALMSRVFGLPR